MSRKQRGSTGGKDPDSQKIDGQKTDGQRTDRAAASSDPRRASPSLSGEPAETAAAIAPSAQEAGPKSKASLPAFGFAEDLLREIRQKPVDPAARAAAVAMPAPDDPQRIFSFADELDLAGEEEEREAAPVRLATWVTFGLAGELFAMPVEPVREVLRVAAITRVPHAPTPIRGVTNLRGRVIPVIDLRVRIGLATATIDRSHRVIVVSSRGRLLGLLVDSVQQVVHIDLNRIQPPPEDVMTVQSDYISGVYHLKEQLLLLLDVDRALVIRGPAEQPSANQASGAA